MSALKLLIKFILWTIATPIILATIVLVSHWLWEVCMAHTLIFKVYGDEELLQDIKITVLSQADIKLPIEKERSLDNKGKTQIVVKLGQVFFKKNKFMELYIYISYKDELVNIMTPHTGQRPNSTYQFISRGYANFNHVYVSKDNDAIKIKYVTSKDKNMSNHYYLHSEVALIPIEEFYQRNRSFKNTMLMELMHGKF